MAAGSRLQIQAEFLRIATKTEQGMLLLAGCRFGL
jgi:hypothetical protein